MRERLPVCLVGLLLALLASRGGIGAVNLLMEGRILHALPSAAVFSLAFAGVLGIGFRKEWGQNMGAFGLFLAGVAGVAILIYTAVEAGIAAPLQLPQVLAMSIACLVAACWLRYSAAASHYFARKRSP